MAGDHHSESLCVSWVHVGQFVLLRNRTWGPKCWTQGGGDRVRATGFIGTSEAGSQAGGGPITGRQAGRRRTREGERGLLREQGIGPRLNKELVGRYKLVVVNDELAPADWKSPAEVGNVD